MYDGRADGQRSSGSVARNVALEAVAAEDVRVEAISPQRVAAGRARTTVFVGDLGADQVVEVVLRLTFPYGELGRETRLMVGLDGATERLTWTYADDATNDAQRRDRDVDRAVARQFASRARQEAVQFNRKGDFDGARRILEGTARRIRRYAVGDPLLRGLVKELESERTAFAAPMAEMRLKEVHFMSGNAARSRDSMGRSMKRPS